MDTIDSKQMFLERLNGRLFKGNTPVIQSPMGTGKSKAILSYIRRSKEKSILILTFRQILCSELKVQLPEFTDYRDVNGIISVPDKLIIQVDSLHRVWRGYDMIIIDECSSTLARIKGSDMDPFAATRACKYLHNAMETNKQVVFADALVSELVTESFMEPYPHRNVVFLKNQSDLHHDKVLTDYENEEEFRRKFTERAKMGINIFLVSNSKRFIDEMRIDSEKHGISFLSITGDTVLDYYGSITEDWPQYQVVGISPKIIAGVSYEGDHFKDGYVMGYFTPYSCGANLSYQQLLRARDVKNIDIFVKKSNMSTSQFPTDREEIKRRMKNMENLAKMEGGSRVNVNHETGEIEEDLYSRLFLESTRETNMSKVDFKGELYRILETQGLFLSHTVHKTPITEEEDRTRKTHRAIISKEQKDQEIARIVGPETPEITEEDFLKLKEKYNKTGVDARAAKKYRYKKTYGEFPPDAETYKRYYPLMKQFNTLKFILSRPMSQLESELKEEIKTLAESMRTAECSVYQLRCDTSPVQISHCLNIIDLLGFSLNTNYTEISGDELNFEGLRQYYLTNYKSLDAAFGHRGKHKWPDLLNKAPKIWKPAIMRSTNSRLKSLLGVTVASSGHKGRERFYYLHGLECWDWKRYHVRKKLGNRTISGHEVVDYDYTRRYCPCDDEIRNHHVPDQISHPEDYDDEEPEESSPPRGVFGLAYESSDEEENDESLFSFARWW